MRLFMIRFYIFKVTQANFKLAFVINMMKLVLQNKIFINIIQKVLFPKGFVWTILLFISSAIFFF